MKDLSFEKVVDDAVDFLEILKIPVMLVDKYFEGHLRDYRIELPCDIAFILQVLVDDIPAREATDTFHTHYHCMCIDNSPRLFKAADYTFKTESGFLYSSKECCNIKISYKGILTDEEGYPMVPDDRIFLNALEKYVENKYIRIQWQNGRVPDKVYQDSEQQYAWAVGQCSSALKFPTMSEMESISNMWRTLLVYDNHFSHRFANLGRKEHFRVHNNDNAVFNFTKY